MTERDWDELEHVDIEVAEADIEGGFETDSFDGEGSEPPEAVLDEIEALAAVESAELAAVHAALEAERDRTRSVLARYREAVLTAEPDLPPELVHGDSLDELDASLAAARSAVAEIRARLTEANASVERGFPVGAPARVGASTAGMSAAEKIRRGLEERVRA